MDEQERTTHLTEYYDILLKHKWLILTSLILISALMTFLAFWMKPVYQATCIMVIEKERSTSPLTGERGGFESIYTQSFSFSTHAKLITSRPVLLQVIKKLKLDKLQEESNLEVSPLTAYFSRVKKNLLMLMGQSKDDPTPGERIEELIKIVESKIKVEAVPDTHLLNIRVSDHDPDIAANIANSVAKFYIEFNLRNRMSSSSSTLSWMSDQLYETQNKLEDAEAEFLAFKQQEKLFSLEGRQEGIAGKIDNLNAIYIETRNQRVEVDTKLKELGRVDQSRVDALHVRTLINNPLIDNLYSQLLASEIELSRLKKVYKSKHPKIIQVTSSIENARKKFRDEIQKEVKNLKAELAVLTQKELALKKAIEDFESDSLTTNRKELQYTILQRNVDTHQRLYDILLQRIKESDITGDIDISNIRIAEAAISPLEPIRPNKFRRLILGIFFGLMIGIGLAFLREYLDKTLRTEEDIQSYLNFPVLTVIPEAEKGHYQRPKEPSPVEEPPLSSNQGNQVKFSRVEKLQHLFLDNYASHSSFAEAYRMLRTNILFSSIDKRIQSFVVTSAIDKEGKTLTAANTAFTIAQSGKSVLMIDADLRKPTLSSIVFSSNSPGLSGLLSRVFSTEVNKGFLSEFQIGDLFRLLAMQKKTGILSLSLENEKIELVFYSGQLVDLNWITRPEDEKLAAVLTANRIITAEHAKQALTQQKTTGQKLGFILLNNGYVKKDDLKGPLTLHMMEGLRTALGFSSGNFSFKDYSESDFEPVAFDPVDFNQIYRQLIIGEEPIAFLKNQINSAVVKSHIHNLWVLPAGNIPPNPSELLSSERMSFLLSNLQKRFDFIVIDAPPVVPASDSLLIAPHADGILVVVRSGGTNRELVLKTAEKLRRAQSTILGIVLNSVNTKREGYYKSYFKNYAKYYADRAE